MKQVKLIIICLLFATNCLAKGLTVQELQNILTAGDWNTANLILAKNNFYFNERQEIEDSDTHEYQIIWGHDNSNYSQYADGWILANVDNYGKGKITSVNYQMSTLEDYSNFMSSISSKGYKFIQNDNTIYDGEERLESIYQNSQYLLTISIIKNEESYDTYTTWMANLDYLGGKYDSYNGKKCSYYEDSKTIRYECTLKEGIIVGDYKAYYDNEKLHYIIKQQKDQWLILEYDRNGNLFGNISIPIKNNESLNSGCRHDLKATGYYKFPIHYFPMVLGWYDYEGKYAYEIEGNMNIRVFSSISSNRCPNIMFRVEWDKEAEQYKYTKYDYSESDSLISKTISTKTGRETHYTIYDSHERILEQGQHRDSIWYGELHEYEYNEDGTLYIETCTNYNDKGELHGKQTTTKYLPNGDKEVTIKNFKDDELDGLYENSLYVNNIKYIKSYCHYDNGILVGDFVYTKGDTVAIGSYRDNKLNGRQKMYQDGFMKYRNPYYPVIDTTKLTLICDGYYENGRVVGEEKFYYPCYYTDTINMTKGEHSGELYMIKNYETHEKITLSYFDMSRPSSYRKFKIVEKYDSNWKLNGLTKYWDENGILQYEENYTHGNKDGWSTYYKNTITSSPYKVYFEKGKWSKSQYESGNILITDIKLSPELIKREISTQTGILQSVKLYQVSTNVINEFNNTHWIDIAHSTQCWETGSFEEYDTEGRLTKYRTKDSNRTIVNDYQQNISIHYHNTNSVPEVYYVLDTNNLYTGTYNRQADDTIENISVKNGYRNGLTKIIKNGKVINKIKYKDGYEK